MAEKPFPKQENKELIQEKIIPQIIEDEMKNAYIDYAMSVIIGRALPDARDGLKPVHRRILFAMNELGMQYNKPFKKSARIVGEVLGKYHPHGDTAVYDSLVRMAQDFSLRYPLINGQGNFGSIDGDNAAAMRYTEAKMSKIADELLADIEKETVDFVPNFDGSLREPLVLPSRIPNLLINGCSGIAVGMATNIPPHNIKEICDGLIMLIEKPNSTVMDLLEVIKGPDFPTAAEIAGRQGIIQAYTTGHGIIVIKAKLEVDERAGRKRIIIKEIPYQLNKSNLVEQIADLVKDKKITEIADIRDESDRQGIRIVIDLKKEANTEIVKNLLYANSRLQSSFSIILLALVNNEPKTLDLKSLMRYFLEHRKNIVTRKIKYELKKAEERCHILEGLIVALNNIDTVVELIKKSGNALIAKKELIEKFDLTETQSQSILDMKLQKLSILETKEIKNENTELQKKIREYNEILSNELKIWEIIKQELINIKKNFGDERKTVITDEETDFDIEDLVKDETVVVTVTQSGYIKRIPIETYKIQRRGGKGIIAAGTKEEDAISQLFITNTHSYILIFTNQGKIHWLKVYKIPEASRQALGKAIVNFVELKDGEIINAIISIKEFNDKEYLTFCTERGIIKKTNLAEYSRPRQGGIIAINLDAGDRLVKVMLTNGMKNIIIATSNGRAVKFDERDVSVVGRNARGVRGIKVEKDDKVIGMVEAEDTKSLLTITENGFGKRTMISEYRLIRRGGSGVTNIVCSPRNGKVVGIKTVVDSDEIIIISKKGIIIRTKAEYIKCIGRNTQGVRLMKLSQDDKVVGIEKIVNGERNSSEINTNYSRS